LTRFCCPPDSEDARVRAWAVSPSSHPGQRAQEGALARPAGAEDRDQAPLADLQRHSIEEDLAVWQFDRQVPGNKRGTSAIDEPVQLIPGYPEGGPPDADDVLLRHDGPADPAPVNERPVMAVKIGDLVAAATQIAQLGVHQGNTQVGHDHLIARRPADPQDARPRPRLHRPSRIADHAAPADNWPATAISDTSAGHLDPRPRFGMVPARSARWTSENMRSWLPRSSRIPRCRMAHRTARFQQTRERVIHDAGFLLLVTPVLRPRMQRLIGAPDIHYELRKIRRRYKTIFIYPPYEDSNRHVQEM